LIFKSSAVVAARFLYDLIYHKLDIEEAKAADAFSFFDIRLVNETTEQENKSVH